MLLLLLSFRFTLRKAQSTHLVLLSHAPPRFIMSGTLLHVHRRGASIATRFEQFLQEGVEPSIISAGWAVGRGIQSKSPRKSRSSGGQGKTCYQDLVGTAFESRALVFIALRLLVIGVALDRRGSAARSLAKAWLVEVLVVALAAVVESHQPILDVVEL